MIKSYQQKHTRKYTRTPESWMVDIRYEPYVPRQERQISSKVDWKVVAGVRYPIKRIMKICIRCHRHFATGEGLALHEKYYHSV